MTDAQQGHPADDLRAPDDDLRAPDDERRAPDEERRAPDDDLRAPDDEGRAYRHGVYRPVDEEALPVAAHDAARFPRAGHGPVFRHHDEVPRVPRLAHLIGPSMIALGMGLGAGEFLLWPNLIAVNGYSIWWLFWVGVLTQFVVIGEIERWTIATGESTFAGMARLDRFHIWPWFFLIATLASFLWPGWASQSAEYVGRITEAATGTSLPWQPVAILMLVFIWIGLAVSKIVYNALERFEIALVIGFFPLLGVALLVAGVVPGDAVALAKGAVSVGSAPPELLTGNQFPTLLLAVAYAGSGGTLLLAQSLWLRDKGFGMGSYQGRIAGIRGANEEVSGTGFVFDAHDRLSLARFLGWMRVAHRELLVTFVLLILISVVITSLLVTSTLGTGREDLAGQLGAMVVLQGEALREVGGVWLEVAFLLGGAFVLFSTQLGIVDTVTRITGTIFYERHGRFTKFWTVKKTFLFFLTLLVGGSIAIIALSWFGGAGLDVLEPDFLVLIAGPFTIASMYAYAIVVGVMNARRLPPALGPATWRRVGMVWAAALWGWFTAEQLSRTVLTGLEAPVEVIETIAFHPARVGLYGFWLLTLAWFAWATLARSALATARTRR